MTHNFAPEAKRTRTGPKGPATKKQKRKRAQRLADAARLERDAWDRSRDHLGNVRPFDHTTPD